MEPSAILGVYMKSNGDETDEGIINIPISDFGISKYQKGSRAIGILWPEGKFHEFIAVDLTSNSHNFYGRNNQRFPETWVPNPKRDGRPKYRFFGVVYPEVAVMPELRPEPDLAWMVELGET